MPSYGFYARGDREEGHFYKVLNYNQNATSSFSLSQIWTVENGLSSCPTSLGCLPLAFNTYNNQPPPDTHEDIIVTMNSGVVGALYSFGTIAGILIIYVVVFYKMSSFFSLFSAICILTRHHGVILFGCYD